MHQLCLVALCFHRLEAVYLHGKFDDIAAEGHQDNRCTHVENRMDKGNLRHIDNALAIGRVQSRKQKHCKNTENNRTRNIEGQMHRTNAFCIFACTDRAQNCSHAGTDILPHDNEYCRIRRNQPCGCQREQDTLWCRGALDNRRYACADQNPQKRIRAHRNKGCLKYLGFSQGINRIRHGIHTDKKDTKPNDDTGYILALLPFPHQRYDYADHNCDWCQCRGAEHFCPFACGNQPTRDGCTDIRTHDNADCLCQIHQPCVYKADNHNRCGRGALDNRRNQCTQRNAHQLILRQHFKNLLHFGAGSVL